MAQYDTQYPALPEQVPPRRKLWPLAGVMIIDIVIILIAVLISTIVISALFIGVRAFQQGGDLIGPGGQIGEAQVMRLLGADGVFAVLLLQNAIFVIVPILRVALLRREPLSEIGFRATQPLRLILAGLGLGALVLVGNIALSALFSGLGIEQNQAAQYPLFQGDYAGQLLFLIGAALLAPIGEEVLFRGYVFNAIRQTFQGNRWGLPLAYIVSAIGFMAAHSLAATEGLLGLLVPTLLMGLLLAWSVHRTGSLIPGIIAHSINNGVALTILLFCVNNPGLAGCPAL